ncbi:hypothetical protein BDV97DRAFT_347477 [Delphinella strobiligena]|nr:hypothetical protein BDV97DRAFT_347477 [Delphinella strobiligena]
MADRHRVILHKTRGDVVSCISVAPDDPVLSIKCGSSKVLLYDIPSKGERPTCWSPNGWKIRLALNYKNIPYDTMVYFQSSLCYFRASPVKIDRSLN